jgi:hypothetical protein
LQGGKKSRVNGDMQNRIAAILNFSLKTAELRSDDRFADGHRGIVNVGHAPLAEPVCPHVLRMALGNDTQLAGNSIRINRRPL